MSFGLRLWATQNLFSHPRYKDGAATSPNFDSFAYGCVAGQKHGAMSEKLFWKMKLFLRRMR